MKLYRYYFLRFRMYTLCMFVEFVFDNRMFGIKNTSTMYSSVNPPYVSSYTSMVKTTAIPVVTTSIFQPIPSVVDGPGSIPTYSQ